MLWDLIRDFFVQHIFGGLTSSGEEFGASTGLLNYFDNGSWVNETAFTNAIFYQVNNTADGQPYYLGLADWLSTTATAITITIIFVLCCLFVYKIIRLIGGLIR